MGPVADDRWASLFARASEIAAPSLDEEEDSSAGEPREGKSVSFTEISPGERTALVKSFRKWARDKKAVEQWMWEHGIEDKLQHGRPLVKISGFLPADVAKGALEVMKAARAADWEEVNREDDAQLADKAYGAGSTGHRFSVGDGGGGEDMRLLCEVVAAALPSRRIHVLQAARYSRGGFIEPHDDAAYVDAVVNGQNTLCSREVAIILYLTEGWDASCGGALIDHKVAPPRVYVPEFNSVVVFKVPRLHEVMKVTTDRPRFSIFGWFLTPGKLYKVKPAAPPPSEVERSMGHTRHGPERGSGEKGKHRDHAEMDGIRDSSKGESGEHRTDGTIERGGRKAIRVRDSKFSSKFPPRGDSKKRSKGKGGGKSKIKKSSMRNLFP